MPETPRTAWRERLAPLVYLSNNLISRLGVLLVTASGIFWLFLLPTYLQGHAGSAYLGILLFLLIPTAFFAGLALIPLGIVLKRKKDGPGALIDPTLPVISWSNPGFRRLAIFVGVATFANVVIAGNLSYRALEHMEGVQFCGATCHVVMKPEYTGYQNSPHSKVECVKCHIGPGASWFVQSKLSGLHQVVAVALNNYDRPIATPVSNLRPARETCEGCHWPDKYGADRLRVITHFSDEGVATRNVLLMKIGGGSVTGTGIHSAHVGTGVSIRYTPSDRTRQTIPWVEYTKDGKSREFFAAKAKPEDIQKLPVRMMDCVDCHNRPSHTFEPAERAVDNAMASGRIAANLPGVKKQAVEILKRNYTSTEQAQKEIPAAVEQLYKDRKADASKAAKAVLAIWERNVFPEMKVTWGTYVNNIGHNDYPGCFRCHDAEHKSKDGKAIEQDCNSCHSLLAMDEAAPKILKDLGVE